MKPTSSLRMVLCSSAPGDFSSELRLVKVAKIDTTGTLFSLLALLFPILFPFIVCTSTAWGDARPDAAQTRVSSGEGSDSAIDPYRSIYPPVAKIVGQGEYQRSSDAKMQQSLFYGSGCYVAEVGEFGIVLTNWHVVGESVGPLLVKFSQFETPGMVLMADTVWDIAAIVVYRPPFLPMPISLEVPQLGDELWVAGFGQNSDLSGYQVSSGPVLGYGRPNDAGEEGSGKWNGGPDSKATLPCETIQIGTGIRYGDSGGPIINRYGELAGILWGSDGHLAMGTFCLRLQAFLTQAQFQLMHYRYSAGEFFARAARKEIPLKKIAMPSVPAQSALRSSGIFPISSEPVYTSASDLPQPKELPAFYKPATVTDIDGAERNAPSKEFLRTQADYKNAHKGGYTLPPYPAVSSPTLTAQRKAIGRTHPEVYVDPRYAAARPKQSAEVQTTGASNMSKSSTNSKNSVKFRSSGGSGSASRGGALAKADPNPKMTAQTVADRQGDSAEKEKGSWLKRIPGFPQIQLSKVQSILAIAAVLFLFVNSLRLLSIASKDN